MSDLKKMNPEVKAKWVAALRSGKFPQAVGMLRNVKGGMCCLGVLCQLYQNETGKGEWKELNLDARTDIDPAHQYRCMTFDGFEGFPPDHVQSWADMDRETEGACSVLNDHDKKSFTVIATFIEKNL